MDLTHLHYLELSLSHERARLDAAKRPGERLVRAGWVVQIEKEIAAERIFLGIAEPIDGITCRIDRMSDDELLAELGNPPLVPLTANNATAPYTLRRNGTCAKCP